MIRWVVLAFAASLPAAHAADLALQKVMLSSAGVGYVEYAAQVDGAATLGLDVPLDQVDDVLISLIVFDSVGGVGGIELPGRDNTAAAFGEVPFGPEALASPLDFLNSLQGVMLEVRGPRPMTGRLLRAERVREPGRSDQPDIGVERTRVTLMAADGLRQFVLEDAEAVEVADPALRGRIDGALEALRRDASRSVRHITLHSSGSATRQVRVGYVAAAALWKASYRLVLPAADGQKARLQGWAVLENATGADWNGVQLSLQYGNPVTFRQAIYRSYFVQRPEVPVEILGRLLPDVDTRATTMAEPAPPPPPAAPKAAMRAMAGNAAAPAPAMAAPAEATDATEGAQETIFSIPSPVTLAAGHTASVPILDREVTARRIGLVQPNRPHPLAAVQLTNDTKTSLPAGVLTLYDPTAAASFAGDARLGGLPAGESRLLSFAEDLRTGVTWRTDEATTVAAVTASQGVLHVDQRVRWTAQIGLTAPAAEARNLLIEVPKRPGTTLVVEAGPAPSEETATAWRLAVALAAGETRTLTVHEDRILVQQTVLMQDDRVVASLLGTQTLAPAARTALQHLADLRAAEAARTAERDRLQAQRGQIEHDEDRTRQNLAAVPPGDALHDRLVRQLDAAEGRIEALGKSIEQANAAVDQAHQALAAAAAGLRL